VSSRARTILIIVVVAVVVVVAGVVAITVTSSGDDDDASTTTVVSQFGTVTVTGDPLPQGQAPDDPDVGKTVPTITGVDYTGQPVAIEPGQDGPMMIVVMAHWCPHCNEEVPKLVQWQQSGKVPAGLDVVGVSTAVRDNAANYPPSTWLSEKMKWTWPVIADDQEQTAATALGTTGYPFVMFIDADGKLMFRVAAELSIDDIQQLADAAAAT
jgi:cytochrome c biogenesis protein CcmG, thiol:disulfide interchange protein DsbE